MSFTANVDINVDVDLAGVAGVAGDIASNAKIIPIMPPGVPVIFSYNPTSIKVTRKAKTDQKAQAENESAMERWRKSSPLEVTFDGYFEGPQTRIMAEQLLSFIKPATGLLSMLAALAGINLSTQLPTVMFMWGTYVIPQCNVVSCTVDYQRFHISGVPLRAKCTGIKLKEIPMGLPFTNPTSGGLPGREQHVVVAGESLPQLAMRTYGKPAHWRDIARVNKVDDPFAVNPGDNLFLPARGELERRNRA